MRTARAFALALLTAATLFGALVSPASAHHRPCHPKSACEVPEVPWTLVLPAASFGMAGAYYLVARVRGGRGDDSGDPEA